jgi:CRISPR-associated protein (TIGR02710 family)
MPENPYRAMVVSVGGTPAPILFSLNINRPEYICFFISRETKRMMEEDVIPRLEFKPRHYDWIETPSPDLLSDCYGKISKELPALLEKWQVSPEEVCVDYTGGTKTMSAALVLATIEKSCCYSYVGGAERSKGGVGVVIDGKERMHFLDNPWDQIAAAERKEAAILFNRARYASAAEVIEKCIPKVSPDRQPLFKALLKMVRGYDLWDRFRHAEAKTPLFRSRDILITVGLQNSEFKPAVDGLQKNLQFLHSLLASSKPSKLYFYDLLANARRRADLEHKYDDAVARLYRAMEVIAQTELKGHGIDTARVEEKAIPEPLRKEFLERYQSRDDGKIKIPLFGSFRLLEGLKSRTASKFFHVYETRIKSLLNIRNDSILAHGFNPVEESTFENLWKAVLEFSDTNEKDIPKFPVLQV